MHHLLLLVWLRVACLAVAIADEMPTIGILSDGWKEDGCV
jgi:hypothetical protein